MRLLVHAHSFTCTLAPPPPSLPPLLTLRLFLLPSSPPPSPSQFAKIIQNPGPSDLRKAIMQGRRGTWERLSAIHVHCGIELMLDECVSVLNRRRKAALRSSVHSIEERSVGE